MKALKDAVNKAAEEENSKMRNIIESNFRRDVEYEYMFWDMAYKHDPDKKRSFGAYF
jgi:thiaminase